MSSRLAPLVQMDWIPEHGDTELVSSWSHPAMLRRYGEYSGWYNQRGVQPRCFTPKLPNCSQ
eukprot:748771-Amphidinium_carterae.2